MEQTLFQHIFVDSAASFYEWFGSRFLACRRRRELLNPSFTILSNNCWGGHVYRHFGLPYASPTVGLYFYSEEYIRFLESLNRYLFAPLKIIEARASRYAESLCQKKQDHVPIGVLGGDVEIVFLHYGTAKEAYEKWNRRLERVDMDRLFVKFSEQNLCEKRHIDKFCNLPFERKLLLLAQRYESAPEGVVVGRYTKNAEVVNDTTYYADHVNLTEWLNGTSENG